jgi:hypothetical protein
MKRYLIIIFLGLIIATSVSAQASSPNFWKLTGGTTLEPILSSWTVSIPSLSLGAITMTDTLDLNGQKLVIDADADSWLQSTTDDRIDFVTASNTVMSILNNYVGIGTTSPTTELDINGSLSVTASTTFNGVEYLFPSSDGSANQALLTNGAGGLSWGVGSQWTTTGSDIYYSTGNVGIGTSTPSAKLDVVGTSEFTGDLTLTGALSATQTLNAATGDEVAYTLNYTTNKLTSGNDTGLLINQTDTASPGTSNLIDAQVGGVSKFKVSNTGVVIAQGLGLYNGATHYAASVSSGIYGLYAVASGFAYGGILAEVPSATNPVLAPQSGDNNTGIGWAADDQLSLIAGGIEGIRITENTTIDVKVNGTLTMPNDTYFRGLDYAGTGYINMFKVNASNEIELGAPLTNLGTYTFEADSGAVTAMNMPVSATPAAGTAQSFSHSIDSNPILTVYTEADGAGGIQNSQVRITDGTLALPGLSFLSDSNTGIYRTGTDMMSFVAGGVEVARATSTGYLYLPNGLSFNQAGSFKFESSTNAMEYYASSHTFFELDNVTATTTVVIDNGAGFGGCLKVKDTDGVGYTYITTMGGVMTATTTSCE